MCTGTFKREPVSAAASEIIAKRSWSLMGYIVGHTASGIIDDTMMPWLVQSLGDPLHVHVAECELRASVALFVKGSEYVGVALEFSFLNKSIPQLSVVCLSFTFVCACRSGR